MSSVINVLRLVAMSALCCCSIVVLGIGAYIISIALLYHTFIIFDVAIAALTLVTLPPLLIVGLIRKGAVFNFVAVEVAVLGALWVLWLAAASYYASQLGVLDQFNSFQNCDYFDTLVVAVCHELHAMHAFSWLNWLILTVYWPTLLIMALVQQSRGNSVWTKSMTDVNMVAPRVIAVVTPGGGYPPQQQPVMYAPQPMRQQPQVVAPGVAYSPVPTLPSYVLAQSPPPKQPQIPQV